ncbi:hypothetical protein [Streptomyces sp. MS2.AVA.5]|uniref:Uncharacterized protein n=1 Tax=Streptomyces achmelvichensis TaxID=3134111 RepID=A0ACC6PKJ4_9ACTN
MTRLKPGRDTDNGLLPGGIRFGVSPGMVKHEGTQSVLGGEGVREEHGPDLNLVRFIKDGSIIHTDTGE